ncbi:transposase domain-containing protein [Pseudorhodobacter sp.]|uniref:transposase domain-containing protein n=1 Tax=Pseudorhodobacter sp. TaxID=1934400 RepID=UPI003A4C794C
MEAAVAGAHLSSVRCKLNAVEPYAYLTQTLQATVNGHKQSQTDDLLPWNYTTKV